MFINCGIFESGSGIDKADLSLFFEFIKFVFLQIKYFLKKIFFLLKTLKKYLKCTIGYELYYRKSKTKLKRD